jgi:hypothetical protein
MVQVGDVARFVERANHDCERLLVAMFRASQALDGCLVRGVYGEVEAAQPTQGDNRAGR